MTLRSKTLWLLGLLFGITTCLGQDWHANHWSGAWVPSATNAVGQPLFPIPDNTHFTGSPWYVVGSFFTTTNTPSLLGDLRGATITATFRLDATNNPILYYNNDTGYPGRFANVRLFFTTDPQPYNVSTANANELQYWWTSTGWTNLNSGNNTPAVPGTYTLTASLDSLLWSSALGHFADDTNYTQAFLSAASRVAQIGFSFGGGSYSDIGIGVDNVNGDHDAAASFTVLNYSVMRTDSPPTILRIIVTP